MLRANIPVSPASGTTAQIRPVDWSDACRSSTLTAPEHRAAPGAVKHTTWPSECLCNTASLGAPRAEPRWPKIHRDPCTIAHRMFVQVARCPWPKGESRDSQLCRAVTSRFIKCEDASWRTGYAHVHRVSSGNASIGNAGRDWRSVRSSIAWLRSGI